VSVQLSLSLIGSPSCKVSEEGTSAQPHDVAGGKDAEYRDDRDEMIALREEKLSKDRGHDPVKGEVIPLHQIASHSGNDGERFQRS